MNTAYKLTKLNGAELALALEAIRNSLPIEAAIEATKSQKAEPIKKPRDAALNGLKGLQNGNGFGYKFASTAVLENTRLDLAGSKLKDLKARELVVLSQIREKDKITWRERIEQIRRLPKPALRDTGKALDQVARVYSYSSLLGKEQMQLLLKALKIYIESLLEDLENS